MRIPFGDPTTDRIDGVWWRASRTPEGPATVAVSAEADRAHVEAWGPGAAWVLHRARDLLGADDDPSGFVPEHPRLVEAMRQGPELRFGRSHELVDLLVPTIVGQRVTGREAALSYRALATRYGELAPGPIELRVPPDPERMGDEPYYALHRYGIERVRASAVVGICQRHRRIDALVTEPLPVVRHTLLGLAGVGPWTVANVLAASHGDADAVPTGDYHLPNMVAWALEDEPRADDQRMLELLAPYAGHRARALRLIGMLGRTPPRYGPGIEIPNIRRM